MDAVARVVSENHLIAIVIGVVVLLSVYFLFKSLVKITVFVLLVIVLVSGYQHFQKPSSPATDGGQTVKQQKADSRDVLQKGKDAIGKGRELIKEGRQAYEKGKKTVESGKEMLDEGVEKSEGIVKRAKGIIEKIALLFKVSDENGREKQKQPTQ